MMAEIQDLLTLSELDDSVKQQFDIEGLTNAVRNQIQANLISQFGLGTIFDTFQRGGGVDTIHNVRNDVFSSEKVQQQILSETAGYNQKEAYKYRDKSNLYKSIRDSERKKQKTGKLIDPNTGGELRPNEKTDLDHRVALKNVFEDKGRALSGLGVDEAANTEDNLKLTDSSINRSMLDKNKSNYADDLPRKKAIWKAEIERLKNNPNLSPEEKANKIKNAENKLKADAEAIKKSDKEATAAYEAHVNSAYYKSSKFLKATGLYAGKQAGLQGLKAASGAVIYQASDILFDALIPVLKNWKNYENMDKRVDDFVARVKSDLNNLKERLLEVKDAAIAGLGGGFMSALLNTVINSFMTTSKNVARILNDTVRSLWQATKILTSKEDSIPFSIRLKEAVKLVSTALIASGGVILAESIKKALEETPFAPISDIVATGVSAILTGITTALLLYLFDHFGEVVAEFKHIVQTIVTGVTLSVAEIEKDYKLALDRIDSIYQEILRGIYEQYNELNRLSELAFDLNLPGAEQFAASQTFATTAGVNQSRILKSQNDVVNYFNL